MLVPIYFDVFFNMCDSLPQSDNWDFTPTGVNILHTSSDAVYSWNENFCPTRGWKNEPWKREFVCIISQICIVNHLFHRWSGRGIYIECVGKETLDSVLKMKIIFKLRNYYRICFVGKDFIWI